VSEISDSTVTERLLQTGETARVEFKSDASDVAGVGSAVCALLNGEGGTVIVGVDDSGRPVKADLSEGAADALRHQLVERIAPQSLFTVSRDTTAHGPVVVVDVAAGRDKPYAFDGTVYCRHGNKSQRATIDDMRRMVEERAHERQRWERRPASGLEVTDLDADLIDQTVRRAQDARGYKFADPRDRGTVLEDFSLRRHGQLTHGADVLFGTRVALRQPQTRMRVVRFETDRGDRFIDEQLFEGPAFLLLERAMEFLRRHVSISASFPAEQLARESRPQYPFNALREGLVNALVHRDYAAFSGSVSLSVFPVRVEIWNPGRLPPEISIKELQQQTHPSVLVNPDISHVFYLHELMERVGRGTFKIIQECKAWGLKPPKWEAESGVRLTFFGASSRADFAGRLNDRQARLINILTPGQRVRTRDYLRLVKADLTDRQARRDMSELEALGYLSRSGKGMATEFQRTDKALKPRP
jgi:ATP-dependent DNA helicase RecG